MSGSTLPFLMTVVLGATLINVADANAFLKANSHLKEERISAADVQTSMLAEVEGTFGEGTAGSRLRQLEEALAPIYAALPKNDKGYLGHATVRYALHRLFVQRHGWFIKGLDSAGSHRNSTSGATLLKEHVPAYLQDLFEQRLGGRGFGLHELGVLAATIEHLVHSEATTRLGKAFKVHNFLPTSFMSEHEAEDLLETYMMSYILGEDLSNLTLEDVVDTKSEMHGVYMAWNETKVFLKGIRRSYTTSDGSAEQKASGEFDFSLVARVAERAGEQFGTFQDRECRQMKASLIEIEDRSTGRVRLSDFYKPGQDDNWQFQDSVPYLRQLGALDESEPNNPRVIIANYMGAATNCIASSSFYSVCCKDECEGLLGHLEQHIAAPEATTAQIATLISALSSSSVVAPRKLSSALLDRLGDIAAQHGGTVPLHGRLFSQWMHHAYPRECPYPHLSGTVVPQTPDEWFEATGEEATFTDEEMLTHVNKTQSDLAPEPFSSELPWSPEEELLVVRQPLPQQAVGSTLLANIRNVVGFMGMLRIAYGFAHNAAGTKATSACIGVEKLMV